MYEVSIQKDLVSSVADKIDSVSRNNLVLINIPTKEKNIFISIKSDKLYEVIEAAYRLTKYTQIGLLRSNNVTVSISTKTYVENSRYINNANLKTTKEYTIPLDENCSLLDGMEYICKSFLITVANDIISIFFRPNLNKFNNDTLLILIKNVELDYRGNICNFDISEENGKQFNKACIETMFQNILDNRISMGFLNTNIVFK